MNTLSFPFGHTILSKSIVIMEFDFFTDFPPSRLDFSVPLPPQPAHRHDNECVTDTTRCVKKVSSCCYDDEMMIPWVSSQFVCFF